MISKDPENASLCSLNTDLNHGSRRGEFAALSEFSVSLAKAVIFIRY